MHKFGFKTFKNPLPEKKSITPNPKKPEDSINFYLAPISSDITFKCYRWDNATNASDADEMQFSIGFRRITGWEGVCDEDGVEQPFNVENLVTWSADPNAIPYIMKIGSDTLETVFKDRKEAEKQEVGEPQPETPTPEPLPDSLPTS
jgi:hypothetical protein